MKHFSEIDSCFLLQLDKKAWQEIKQEEFILKSGEALQVGDCFTRIGKNGSAGNQPIILTEPWVQRYLGKYLIDEDYLGFPPSYQGRFFILFDALNTEDANDGFVSKRKEVGSWGSEDRYVMAYLDMGDGTLLHIRSSGSSSVCKCDSLERVTLKNKPRVKNKSRGGVRTGAGRKRGEPTQRITVPVSKLALIQKILDGEFDLENQDRNFSE